MTARTPVRIAMVGTFDLENLGDLLFAYVAHHELSARLSDVEIELFSYRALDPPSWPLKVRAVHTLAQRLGEFDLLIVGGGHVVRGDEDVAPGYAPTHATTPHPYGLWMVPTILAAGAGVPVAWNAIGAIDSVDATFEPLVAAALGGVTYLAVRDLPSARFVRAHQPRAEPVVVPDTVFGIARLLGGPASDEASGVLRAHGVDGGYVVVQPAAHLEPCRAAVEAICATAAARGLAVVELPCGPCHHDTAGRLGLSAPTVAIREWPEPLVVAELLAGAQAVVASSLHAGIVATSAGVPLFRPRAEHDSKYELVDLLPGVVRLPADDEAEEVATDFHRGAPSSQALGHAAALQPHWDEMARLATRPGRRSPSPTVVELIETLPQLLVDRQRSAAAELERVAAAHDVERWRDAEARAAIADELAVERDRSAHLARVLRRRSVRAALLFDEMIARMRRSPAPQGDDASGR